MTPGLTTKLSEETIASAASISPKSDLLLVTGTTSIQTIVPPFAGFSGIVFIVPIDGNVATLTTGNISAAITMPEDKVTVLVYSKTEQEWKPAAGI